MPLATGKITGIKIWPLKEESKYGNKFSVTLYLDKERYSLGQVKYDSRPVYVHQGCDKIEVGHEVEFMYTENNGYKNIKKTTMSITGGEPIEYKSKDEFLKGAAQTPTSPIKKDDDYVNPAVIGQILNLMVDLKVVKSLDAITPAVADKFIAQYKQAKEVIEASYRGKPQPPVDQDDVYSNNNNDGSDLDDDIPF